MSDKDLTAFPVFFRPDSGRDVSVENQRCQIPHRDPFEAVGAHMLYVHKILTI